MKSSHFIIFVLIDILLSVGFFILKPKPTIDTNNTKDFTPFENTENYTNLVSSISLLSEYLSNYVSLEQKEQNKKTNNELDVQYSCSFLNGKVALQFSGSSGIYFLGEFCPYGKLLTITPYRAIVKRGQDFLILNNKFEPIKKDPIPAKDENENKKPNLDPNPSFEFFDINKKDGNI